MEEATPQSFCDYISHPPRVLAQVLFSIKITSKKIPIRYFEFNSIFTKKKTVMLLNNMSKPLVHTFLDDVKEISRGCIYFIVEL